MIYGLKLCLADINFLVVRPCAAFYGLFGPEINTFGPKRLSLGSYAKIARAKYSCGAYIMYSDEMVHHVVEFIQMNEYETNYDVPVISEEMTFPSKSAHIRYLAKQGLTRYQIAKKLNIRYQHVRNVLINPPKKA